MLPTTKGTKNEGINHRRSGSRLGDRLHPAACHNLAGACRRHRKSFRPWVSSDYQCPGGTKHNEQLLITQNGSLISAVKTAGDDCVPTGHESFTGTVTGNSGMMRFWTGAPGVQPFLGAANEELVIQDANTFFLSGPAGNYTVTRATTSN
jgi:hypothetical protein